MISLRGEALEDSEVVETLPFVETVEGLFATRNAATGFSSRGAELVLRSH